MNFAVFSRHASAVSLVLYTAGGGTSAEIALDPESNRTGDVWHVQVGELGSGVEYGWRVEGPDDSRRRHRYDGENVLLDPYAREVAGAEIWSAGERRPGQALIRPRRSRVIDDEFDWGDDRPLGHHLADSVIYELHVRGFTQHPTSGVARPGTFAGVVEKIPYLKDLGVTAVELLPVTEFEELDCRRVDPLIGDGLVNFWGYHPISFFAPKTSYASKPEPGEVVREFKTMVRALHRAGIEVILDVVFNHTGEGDDEGPTLSLRGLDNSVYYLLDPVTGEYRNFSGCGNTVNCNHPVVRDLILDALRYWVSEMHVDGFRFDLASILGRGRDGSVLTEPPLLERIAADPVLAQTKLIAEAWDAAGLYQVGTFPSWGRWAEWNGRFRDDVRRIVRGEGGMAPALATRLAGSADLYQHDGRAPYHSINFVTSHDGFTLADLVSYDRKQNLANGEGDRDGHPDNLSWNCGVEGPDAPEEVRVLRRRQMKNLATLLLVSQGVPMLLAGDEFGRTQRGNNNAYCQDNEISWIDWRLLDRNDDLHRFFRKMIAFRRSQPALRRRAFFEDRRGDDREVAWHGLDLEPPDWSAESRTLGMRLFGRETHDDLYLLVNAGWDPVRFRLPMLRGQRRWLRFVDTGLEPPREILDESDWEEVTGESYEVRERVVALFVGR